MLTDGFLQKLSLLPHVNTYWIAFSGGLDSHVLLHLCTNVFKDSSKKFRAIHVNHNLSPHARAWQKHCQNICEQLNISWHGVEVDATPQRGKSPEAVARELRYQVFRELLAPGQCLLTAHHQNDQAETLLLQLIRGAGPAGLAAMPEVMPFAAGFLLRPLLHFTRDQLKNYAIQHSLQWIEDESNFDVSYDRNFIRHHVIPLLQQRWPATVTTLARTATNCAEATELLQSLGEQDLIASASSIPSELPLNTLRQLDILDPSYNRSRNALRAWLKQQNFALPNRTRLQQLHHDFLKAKSDTNPYMTWEDVEIRRYQDTLYAMKRLSPIPKETEYCWDLTSILNLPAGLGKLAASKQSNQGFLIPDNSQHVLVRFRRGGERCQPSGRRGTHSLKKLLQEWNVPPWLRDRIPLIYWQEQLVAVVGYCVCEPFKVPANKKGWLLQRLKDPE